MSYSLLPRLLLVSAVCYQLFFVCLGQDCCGQGPAGRDGTAGRDGRDGRDGTCLDEGLKGEKGEPGDDGGSTPSSGQSTVYVRWGRKTCSDTDGAQLLYEGAAGGTHYSHPGGGADYLCLPLDPIYDDMVATGARANVYGAEYETGDALQNDDVPCAVCLAPRGTLLNIPARNVCPGGWVKEYSGYLMAEHYNHPGPKQHICMDRGAETRDGTSENKDGALFYYAEGSCGSLPCEPYVDGGELTCAVCTL